MINTVQNMEIIIDSKTDEDVSKIHTIYNNIRSIIKVNPAGKNN
jgi:hypothetical protein